MIVYIQFIFPLKLSNRVTKIQILHLFMQDKTILKNVILLIYSN